MRVPGRATLGYELSVPRKVLARIVAPRTLIEYKAEKHSSEPLCSSTSQKDIWIETDKKEVFTAALEAGGTSFFFHENRAALAEDWRRLGKFTEIYSTADGRLRLGAEEVGRILQITTPQDLSSAEALADVHEYVVMDATDWQIIPAENLVAAFQGKKASLFGIARSTADARVLLEALEVGTDGVILRTEDPAEVRSALAYIREAAQRSESHFGFVDAKVTRIEQVGMGDRVAVDLCSLLVPGEGLLVGSFSRGLFLVHSECTESSYINSRPFRINCGPVHAYVAAPNGKTAYLSELISGAETLVVDASGKQKAALVGRAKIERRPLVLIEAEAEGERFSILLQNAETVRLVGPGSAQSSSGELWSSTSVTELKLGDSVLLYRTEAARHTGIAIEETIVER